MLKTEEGESLSATPHSTWEPAAQRFVDPHPRPIVRAINFHFRDMAKLPALAARIAFSLLTNNEDRVALL